MSRSLLLVWKTNSSQERHNVLLLHDLASLLSETKDCILDTVSRIPCIPFSLAFEIYPTWSSSIAVTKNGLLISCYQRLVQVGLQFIEFKEVSAIRSSRQVPNTIFSVIKFVGPHKCSFVLYFLNRTVVVQIIYTNPGNICVTCLRQRPFDNPSNEENNITSNWI